MVRAHIRMMTNEDCKRFVDDVNLSPQLENETVVLQNETGRYQVDARSLLGVIYAACEFNDHLYMVNLSEDGHFPGFVDKYRVL